MVLSTLSQIHFGGLDQQEACSLEISRVVVINGPPSSLANHHDHAKANNPAADVQSKPPEAMEIAREELEPVQPPNRNHQQMKDHNEQKKNEERGKPKPSAEVVVAVPKVETNSDPAAAPVRRKKLQNVKRVSSAGLLAESVLQTKTGHLKEYYTLGKKLGHGHSGLLTYMWRMQPGKSTLASAWRRGSS